MSDRRCGTCVYFPQDREHEWCSAPAPYSVNEALDRFDVQPDWDCCPVWTPADKAARIEELKRQIAELEGKP